MVPIHIPVAIPDFCTDPSAFDSDVCAAVESFVDAIAADGLMSALTIDPSAIFADVTELSTGTRSSDKRESFPAHTVEALFPTGIRAMSSVPEVIADAACE